MKPDLIYFQEKIDHYNKMCFGNRLPKIPIVLNSRKIRIGAYRRVDQRDGEGNVSTMRCFEFSIRYDLPEEEFIDTIVHEMIHYYIDFMQLKDDGIHGSIFMKLKNEISEKYNIKITVEYEPDVEELINQLSHTRYIWMAELTNDEVAFAVVAKNRIRYINEILLNSGRFDNVRWFASNRNIFSTFPTNVNPRYHIISAEKLRHYLTGAEEINI